ncbi:Galactose-binding domain-like protein [Cynara cardunculus var. scolymus]|uniref:Galactose-binding domain-like protein n=1 Tax=Cynara cardunculus var. scolymus TaxID=59895 RepID=A0A103WK37_CYNCS|nr:Galactose-binding domain-like protein [Cynara cardunculus var. scolymus]
MGQGYREDEGLNLESDADEQLLIYIPFTQVIKLHSIVIKGPEEEGPQTVKLYTNKEHMGFSLTIFIEDNQSGSDITKVQKMILQGTTVETTDMKGLKKIEDH